ncbi:MAG: ABC transporter permease [Oscillospiraceae bacterium]|jgi:hypothetical protein|nr:ABC transporter permease [Oscillospiraceae bacterium]
MTNTFESPAFGNRVRSMLKLDFYRLLHTPAFYIFLVIAAIIPAMVLSLAGADMSPPQSNSQYSANTPQMSMPEFDNAWQMIESTGGSAIADDPLDFAGFANINMLFIFAGLLMSIFVAHDYSSGFVKNIFTVHSKRIDYVIAKSAIGMFSGASMIVTYVLGTVIAGLLSGKAFDVNVSGLIFCLISKAFLMGIFCSLFLGVAVFFRNKLWLTIAFTFLLGMMLYPAATNIADLNSTVVTMLLALIAGAVGAIGFGAVSLRFLKKRDLA